VQYDVVDGSFALVSSLVMWIVRGVFRLSGTVAGCKLGQAPTQSPVPTPQYFSLFVPRGAENMMDVSYK
jgi:hypothetical protein